MWKDACRMKDLRIDELEFSLKMVNSNLEHAHNEAHDAREQLQDLEAQKRSDSVHRGSTEVGSAPQPLTMVTLISHRCHVAMMRAVAYSQ